MSIRILGTGSGLPALSVSNDDLTRFLETSDEWIRSRTGIGSRHICVGESLTDLAVAAAQNALQAAALQPVDLDLILCATLQSDHITPSLACMVQRAIGAVCPATDLNAACSGFLYALDMAGAYIDSGRASRVLIVCADQMSKFVDWNDRATCVLFGDGAGACVVAAGRSLQYLHLTATGDSGPLRVDGQRSNHPFCPHPAANPYLQMEGQEVFKFAVTTAGREIRQALADTGLAPDDISLYLLHQANLRIIESIRTRLKLPLERFPISIDHTGNCSSASIPMLLDELVRQGSIQCGDRLLLTAFGAGMTSGTCILQWQ